MDQRAKDILEQTGAEDIASAGESSADYGRSDKPLPRSRVSEPGSRSFSDPAIAGDPMRRGVSTPVAEYDYEDQLRDDFNRRYYREGTVYEHYAPAYRHGAACAADARWTNRDWSVIESDVRRDWERRGEGA